MKIPLRILIGEYDTGTLPRNWEEQASQWEMTDANWEDTIISTSFNEGDFVLDMFKDESVTIKQSVKDLADPKKLFTDYSQQFSVPATKKNNGILRHYYNIDIVDGLDSRSLLPCKLFLGNTVFKDGNISVESIKMYRGKPMQYNLRFVGLLSDLAKKIGQDELTQIGLEQYNIDNVNLQNEFSTGAMDTITFPLASKSGRYLADSANSDVVDDLNLENAKNIRYVNATRQPGIYGITDQDVVGAMRVGKILDAIEDTYNLEFTGCFTRNYIRDLYLWLHKADKQRDGELLTHSVENISWTPTDPLTGVTLTNNAIQVGYVFDDNSYYLRAKATWTGQGKLVIKKNGNSIAEQETSNSYTNTILLEPGISGVGNDQGTYTFEFQYEDGAVSSVDVEVDFVANETALFPGEVYPDVVSSTTYTGTESITLGSGQYEVNKNLPQMKVMDFLTSLFKMFNVVAETSREYDDPNARAQSSGPGDVYISIHTEHFDRFMSRGVVRDYTQMMDHTQQTISKPNLYSSLKFEFEPPKTAMEQGFLKVNARPYGSLSYQVLGGDGLRLSGAEYNLDVKNQRIPCERLYNLTTKQRTSLVYTQFGDLKGSEQTTKPKFTYVAQVTNGTGVAWDDGGSVSNIINYCMPSNVYAGGDIPNSVLDPQEIGLYFGEELNEHATNASVVGLGLVNNFYRGMLSMMFDEDKRQVKMRGHLSAGQILQLKLSDILRIGNYFYNINAISTNYLSGITDFDLTVTGRVEIEHFQLLTRRVTNTNGSGGADLRITYMNQNGFIDSATIAGGAYSDIDCIGQISSFSHSNYTDVVQ